MLKFYLGRILGTYEDTDSVSGPLCYYQEQFRTLIRKVLTQSEDLGPSAPYIPLLYQLGLQEPANMFSVVIIEHVDTEESIGCLQKMDLPPL